MPEAIGTMAVRVATAIKGANWAAAAAVKKEGRKEGFIQRLDFIFVSLLLRPLFKTGVAPG